MAPRILDHGTRWRRVVSFTTRLFYLRVKSSRYPLYEGWVGPRAGLDAVAKKKKSYSPVNT